MKFTPSSTARRSTRTHSSASAGGPQTPLPVMRIAPNPSRLTVRSPPMAKVPDFCATEGVVTRTNLLRWCQADRVKLSDLATLSLTYTEVGATAGAMPDGYHHLQRSAAIGSGRARFAEAGDA